MKNAVRIVLAILIASSLLVGCDFLKKNGYAKEIAALENQVSTLTQSLNKAVDEPTKAKIRKDLQAAQKKLGELLQKASKEGAEGAKNLLQDIQNAVGQ